MATNRVINLTSNGSVRFYEAIANGTDYVELRAPAASLTGTYTLTLPADNGDADQVLGTDGLGGLDWVDVLSNPLGDTLTWADGLGGITHLLGPTDEDFAIEANTGRGLVLTGDAVDVNGALVTIADVSFDAAKVIPLVDATTDLGSTLFRWASAYLSGIVSAASTFMTNATSLDGDLTTVTGATPGLVVVRNAATNHIVAGVAFGANDNAPAISTFKTRAASGQNANTIVAADDGVLSLTGYAADGASYRACAMLTFAVDGTPGASDMPGRMVFAVTADGAATPTEAMRIQQTGNVAIGTDTSGSRLTVQSGSSATRSSAGFFGTYSGSAAFVSIQNLSGAHTGSGLLIDMAAAVKFINTTAGAGTPAFLSSAGVWTDASCFEEFKREVTEIDPEHILAGIERMRIVRYFEGREFDEQEAGEDGKPDPRTTEDRFLKSRWFLSCLQDDLVEHFGLDSEGVVAREVASLGLAGIQALLTRVKELEARVRALDRIDAKPLPEPVPVPRPIPIDDGGTPP